MRLRGRTDGNQAAIVRGLRRAGCSVQVLSSVGKGCPDLLVGFRGVNFLLEVKDPAQPPNARKLTPDEWAWHRVWTGQVGTVETLEDAYAVVGIHPMQIHETTEWR